MQDMRDMLVKKLRWSFFGPNHTDTVTEVQQMNELETEDPGKSYITGILAPQLHSGEDENSDDESPFSKTAANDSSFGFTFSVHADFKGIVSYGADFSTYLRSEAETGETFIRVPHAHRFELDFQSQNDDRVEQELLEIGKKKDKIKLLLIKRTDITSKEKIIYTLSIVHFGKEDGALRPWRNSLFQVRIWADAGKDHFCDLPFESLDLTEDKRQASLLYRSVHRYSVAHGCGVSWNSTPPTKIESTFFPSVDVPVFNHMELDTDAISMLKWAKGSRDYDVLSEIPENYLAWIKSQRELSIDFPQSIKSTFESNELAALEVYERIRHGINILETDENVRQSFQWMNLAMLTQQIQSKAQIISVIESKGKFEVGEALLFDPLDPNSWPIDHPQKFGKWRLFQLAFILMCIPDVVSDKEPSMDLIWFPTGGGKTEAYLGLSAFVLLFERLIGNKNKGVQIIMRYTLRLLTAQQFDRAASMIVALEDIRIANPEKLGNTLFQIGLWVGGSVTFNKHGRPNDNEYTKDPKTANAWFSNLGFSYYNRPWPWVLQKCPRCSREFGVKGSGANKSVFGVSRTPSDNKIIYSCPCSKAENHRLPIVAVDEDIYQELPSMVIATVDKFARLPWSPEASKLLGVNALGRGIHSQVKLIIQDELHLLEGPLGTIVGLYESAIDFLIGRTGASPKRIGSSATLAMAKDQCKSLYGLPATHVKVFPPPLLNWNDNYFSYVDSSSSGRRYVGVYANGSPSIKTTQYKLFASLLQTGGEVAQLSEEFESYSTLISYFNSTRDMGQALSLMGDDVPRELRNLARKFQIAPEAQRKLIDINQGLVQLHGNVKSDTVQKDMSRLLIPYNKQKHVHTVLATNMISVGLDVPRLSLMAIIHQPKTISEYIQASSRVGRGKVPGIVFTILSAKRARDRSHLEDFITTHNKMYSLVEPSSLTPFSLSALERALPGVLISIFRNDPEHGLFETFGPTTEEIVELVKDYYQKRISVIDPGEWKTFEAKFDDFCRLWNRGGFRSFGKELFPNSHDYPLMIPFLTPCTTWSIQPFQVLQAMRNVDSGIELKQLS